MKLGVLCATEREIKTIKEKMSGMEQEKVLGRTYFSGRYMDRDIVVSECGVGKVSVALTIAGFVEHFHCDEIVFLGTAGALAKDLRVGDVVISTGCVQHDFDGRPFVDRCVVFSMKKRVIDANEGLVDRCEKAAKAAIAAHPLSEELRTEFHISEQHVRRGVVASGDQFIASADAKAQLLERVPEALCCEMEGAALAQACVEAGVPFCVIRVISDSGDGSAFVDFNKFCDRIAGNLCYNIFEAFVKEK